MRGMALAMGEQGIHGQCRVMVLGMGATGASVARYLAARGDTAVFCDTRSAAPGRGAIAAAMPDAQLYAGPELPSLAHTVEQVVVSPGVPLDLPPLVKARERGLEICSDIDLFMGECRAPVIAVTGSNGKSTVTAMTAAALAGAGWHAPAGGNLGTPALDLLDATADAYVLELSSFQLERSQPLAAAAAVVLNLSPDHLDTHGGFDAYMRAKARIYLACRHAVVNRDEPRLAALPGRNTAVSGFTLFAPESGDFAGGPRIGRRAGCRSAVHDRGHPRFSRSAASHAVRAPRQRRDVDRRFKSHQRRRRRDQHQRRAGAAGAHRRRRREGR